MSSNLSISLKQALDQLLQLQIAAHTRCNSQIASTELGRIMARYHISYDTAQLFVSLSHNALLTNRSLLRFLSCLKELEQPLRRSERAILRQLNEQSSRFFVASGANHAVSRGSEFKCNVLLQSAIESSSIQDQGLLQDQRECVSRAKRISCGTISSLIPRNYASDVKNQR